MARGAHVKQEDAELSPTGEQKASKRRCVQSACVPCRKRKSKVRNPDSVPDSLPPRRAALAEDEAEAAMDVQLRTRTLTMAV
jgi:hypothetical protein